MMTKLNLSLLLGLLETTVLPLPGLGHLLGGTLLGNKKLLDSLSLRSHL
jgi:hypothetical protein